MFRIIKITVDILDTDVHVDEAKKTKCYAVFLSDWPCIFVPAQKSFEDFSH